MSLRAFCELSEDGKRIEVHFPYDPRAVAAMHKVDGNRFVPKDKGGPFWTIPLDMTSANQLRDEFGRGLTLGDAVKEWGRTEAAKARNLRSLASASDAELERLPTLAPRIARAIAGEAMPDLGLGRKHPLSRERPARPYQRADIAMMAITNVLNANQPGTGKTIETLGAWAESGVAYDGPHLVIAPVRSLENVWLDEICRWLPDLDVYTSEDPRERKEQMEAAVEAIESGQRNVVLSINFDPLRLKKVPESEIGKHPVAKRDHKGNEYTWSSDLQRRLMAIEWRTTTIDEFHKAGLGNRVSLFSLGMSLIKSDRKYALSGTPIGGKPRKLWAILNWLEPEVYTSEWRWIGQWLEVSDNGYGKKVGDLKPGYEDRFYEAHAKHMVRRLKREALPGLPPKAMIVVSCKMTKNQKKQYEKFAADAEIRIEEERLSATNVLSEYARLKQFANAAQELRDGVPYPLPTQSGKLDQLIEKLDEEGIRKDEPEPGARAIVATESARFAVATLQRLEADGIACDLMTGDTTDTRPIIKRFKSDEPMPYVIVMTTQTGGVSLNLEEADSIHALDETWNPDDMEQLFDRGDRGSRTTPLRCYIYRTRNTIQEYIAEINEDKAITNKNILDLRRHMIASIEHAA